MCVFVSRWGRGGEARRRRTGREGESEQEGVRTEGERKREGERQAEGEGEMERERERNRRRVVRGVNRRGYGLPSKQPIGRTVGLLRQIKSNR